MPRHGKAIIVGASQDFIYARFGSSSSKVWSASVRDIGLCIINDRHARTELHIGCCASTATQKFPTGS